MIVHVASWLAGWLAGWKHRVAADAVVASIGSTDARCRRVCVRACECMARTRIRGDMDWLAGWWRAPAETPKPPFAGRPSEDS